MALTSLRPASRQSSLQALGLSLERPGLLGVMVPAISCTKLDVLRGGRRGRRLQFDGLWRWRWPAARERVGRMMPSGLRAPSVEDGDSNVRRWAPDG